MDGDTLFVDFYSLLFRGKVHGQRLDQWANRKAPLKCLLNSQ